MNDQPVPINLLIEDSLSRSVVSVMLREASSTFAVRVVYDEGGYSYIKSKAKAFNQTARFCPCLILTDLDMYECAPSLRDDWFGDEPLHPNLIFWVAIREIEAWILSDRQRFATFLGIDLNLVPAFPEQVPDPKEEIVRLARHSRFPKVRAGIVPDLATKARVGPDFNGTLIRFVTGKWRIKSAMAVSPSLARAYERICAFHPQ